MRSNDAEIVRNRDAQCKIPWFSWRTMRNTLYSQSELVIFLATSFDIQAELCSRVGVRSRARSVFLLCADNLR